MSAESFNERKSANERTAVIVVHCFWSICKIAGVVGTAIIILF